MSANSDKNMVASVATRLLARARTRNEDYQFLLIRYALERLMWRLAQSRHSESFIVKGAMGLLVWSGEVYRPTKDLDLLAQCTETEEWFKSAFEEICKIEVEDDGLVFLADSIDVAQIRDDQAYGGVRLTMRALLGRTRIPVQIDIGFGDAVTPEAGKFAFPVLLEDSHAPIVRVYPREVSIAEKLEAMVSLGMANSRMKDYYDIYVLREAFTFDGGTMASAIRATFIRRKTAFPTVVPLGLLDEFAFDPMKNSQWKAFRSRGGFRSSPPELPEVVSAIRNFLLPPLMMAATGKSFDASWSPGGPWEDLSQ